jgi:hypothetical protein
VAAVYLLIYPRAANIEDTVSAVVAPSVMVAEVIAGIVT